MAHALSRDALVWTEGLSDWLPLGYVPHVDDLPPMPRGASPEVTQIAGALRASPAPAPLK